PISLLFSAARLPPRPTLFPYTTLFRSAVGCSLLLFFLLKDLGPALVPGFLFLVMFALARGRSGLALAGIVLLVAGVTIGYRLGEDRKSTRLKSSHLVTSYAVFWLYKKR